MKVRIVYILIVLVFACCSEPNHIIYEFKMINDSDRDYVVKRHYRYTDINSRTDTLAIGDELVFSIPRVGSYDKPFGDTLIRSFFDTLLVKMLEPEGITYVYKRSDWKEEVEFDKDFLEKPGSIKGKVIYTLKMGSVVQ